MFKVNPDGMRMEPTPERVLSVCRLVAHNRSMTREDVREAMTLNMDDKKEIDQINKSINVALEELSLIKTKSDQLQIAVDPRVFNSNVSFRRYVSKKVFTQKNTTFFMFSRWLLSQNERIFKLRTWDGIAKTCGAEISELSTINENAVLGWRFWAAFLGLGYLSGTMIIPNMKLRLEDLLATDYKEYFKYGQPIRAEEFISWLANKTPEVDITGRFPLALSAGLRTLHELGYIELETRRDSNRTMLYYIDGDPINDFSHITVKEVVAI